MTMTGSTIAIPGLETLHEIIIPPVVSWMPRTIGWYALFGLMVLGLIWLTFLRVRSFQANQYRRLALQRIDLIAGKLRLRESRENALAELSFLMKWTALSAYPRTRVAGLSGVRWLAFLDYSMGGNEFDQGQGRLLAELAYAPLSRISSLPDKDVGGLIQLCRRWIKMHAPAVALDGKEMPRAPL